MRTVTNAVLEKIKQWEGFKAHAYDDATGAPPNGPVQGTLTIGYGHTGSVKPTDVIDERGAEALLRADLIVAEDCVEHAVKVELSENQFGALVSFAFNVGNGAFIASTLLKRLNRGDYSAVPAELARWNKTTINGKKVVSPGLVNRRAAEAGLWAAGNFVTSSNVPAAPSTPPILTKETISWGAGILGSLTSLFAGSGPVQYALAAVIVVGVGVGLWTFLHNRKAA